MPHHDPTPTRPGELGRYDSQALRDELAGIKRKLRGDETEGRSDMVIPRSTLIVGAALWGILVGMQVWVINRQQVTADAASELKTDVGVLNVKVDNVTDKVGDVKESQISMDRRLSNMEARQARISP